jgi:hypothetical protein
MEVDDDNGSAPPGSIHIKAPKIQAAATVQANVIPIQTMMG